MTITPPALRDRTDQGTIIRTPASDLSVLSRSAGGVIVMRLPEDQYVANFTVVAREEDGDQDRSDEIMTDDLTDGLTDGLTETDDFGDEE